jgi:hypothetical protein
MTGRRGYSSQDCRHGQSGTIILVGMPRGQHKVLIEVVDPEGNVFTRETVTFQSPGKELKS